jgi:cytochrome c biogenesis protein CcmG/thiol:disulfide interchange protein DsbE
MHMMEGHRRIGWVLAISLLLSSPALSKSAPKGAGSPPLAPRFTLPTRDGTVSLDSLRGKVVYVDFWASWCVPCKESFPWMKTLNDRFAGKGLVIVAIDLDKDRGAADSFLEKYPAPFPVAFDPSGKTAKAFKVWGMPTSYIVSPTGTILSTHPGFDAKRAPAIESEIAAVLPK